MLSGKWWTFCLSLNLLKTEASPSIQGQQPWVCTSNFFHISLLINIFKMLIRTATFSTPGFEISNWMHLSVGQVDCKNHLSECTFTCLKYIKPMQFMWKSEIRSRPSDKSCRYSTCLTVIFTCLRRSDEWNFEPCTQILNTFGKWNIMEKLPLMPWLLYHQAINRNLKHLST